MAFDSTAFFRTRVKEKKPSAALQTNGWTYWVSDGDRKLSREAASAENAWMFAAKFLDDAGE